MRLAATFKCCEDFSTYEVEDRFYDFHNDFDCKNIVLRNNILSIKFKNLSNDTHLFLNFHEVEVKVFTFFNDNSVENLTLDIMYRGRFENNGELNEFLNEKGYFYIDFFEGQKIEFWAASIDINDEFSVKDTT